MERVRITDEAYKALREAMQITHTGTEEEMACDAVALLYYVVKELQQGRGIASIYPNDEIHTKIIFGRYIQSMYGHRPDDGKEIL